MFAVGNEELEGRPTYQKGDSIICEVCGDSHPLTFGSDLETSEVSTFLAFYSCGETSYLAGIDGKLLSGIEKGAPNDR